MSNQIVNGAVFGEQFLGGCLTHARTTRNIIRTVAHPYQQNDYLMKIGQALFV